MSRLAMIESLFKNKTKREWGAHMKSKNSTVLNLNQKYRCEFTI